MKVRPIVIAALGCTGEVARPIVSGFLQQGVTLRLLARDPDAVSKRYPGAEIIAGSMADSGDVERALGGVDAAFLMTPMGMCDDAAPEIAVARAAIAGAASAGLQCLIYTSVLGADRSRGVGILDAKYEIEKLIRQSGIPHIILRCGSYMEDVFDPRIKLLNKGRFLFPINKQRRFSYTAQRDLPRFAVQVLESNELPRRAVVNFVAPGQFSLQEVEQKLSSASGITIRATSRFPTYYLYRSLLPLFRARKHRFSSIIPLIVHFDRHGYTDDGPDVAAMFPTFRMTRLKEHLAGLWPEMGH